MASDHVSGESRRFRSTAVHYLAGRPAYADRLTRRVAAMVGLGSGHTVLDLGCGPGQLTRAFAPLAGSVLAMDPEPAMLDAAREASAGIANIRFLPGGSDDLDDGMGPFRLVVMGRSFHWMDRAETLRRLDRLIEPGGAVALFHTSHADVPENTWVAGFDTLRRTWAGRDLKEPTRSGAPWVRHEAILLHSRFCRIEGCSVVERREIEAARLLDRVFSMSTSSPERLGGKAREMAHAMEVLLNEIAPDGRLTEVIVSDALVARRPGEETFP